MTVVRRRTAAAPARRRGKPAPLKQRFPIGRRVQVYEDVQDQRYAERFGTVVAVSTETDETYPQGRVGVRLVIDELYAKLYFSRDRVPQPVWFKPGDLDRSPDA